MAVWAAKRPKVFQARFSLSSAPYFASCSSALGLILLVVEDLEQQLVADVGLQVEARGLFQRDFLRRLGNRLGDNDDLG